ncbi:glutamyl-tRNA reductase [Thermodesulfobacteriota bacterium]
MSNIILLGLNHKTAPIEIRECIAFSNAETTTALDTLRDIPVISEVMLLSTCNRVEVLFVTEDNLKAIEAVKSFIADANQVQEAFFEESLYTLEGDEAVRHIFRVASSLDSMVVGEPQILGQIKEAYQTAVLKKTPGVILNRLLHRAFFVAKHIRNETGIGDRAVSISYAAITLGRKIFDTLENKKVLLIGTGEMAELAVEHLRRDKAGDIYVANRTLERSVALAKNFEGKAIRFEEIADYLQQVDVVISSTGAPHVVITRQHVKPVMRSRRNRPLFFIDIAVPRDIDPQINQLPNVYVYDIDDLKGVIEENLEDRKKEAVKGERMVDEAVINFREWCESQEIVPTLVALREKIDTIAKGEIDRTLKSLSHLSDDDHEAINRMKNALVKKILHDPTLFLKGDGFKTDRSAAVDMARKLFNLDD